MNALTRALPFSMRDQASVASTSAAVRGPSDPGCEAFRIAAETVAKAPFPLSERKTLARAYRSLGPGHNICLSRKKDWVTNDGRFATELEIDGVLSGTLAERNQVHQIICRFITSQASGQGVWEKGNPNDLKFRSKRQLKCLKQARKPSSEFLKAIGHTGPLSHPVMVAVAAGIEAIAKSANPHSNEAKAELQLLGEAAENVDKTLAEVAFKLKDDRNFLKKILDALFGDRLSEDQFKIIAGLIPQIISDVSPRIAALSNPDQSERERVREWFGSSFDRIVGFVRLSLVNASSFLANATQSNFLPPNPNHESAKKPDVIAYAISGKIYLKADFWKSSPLRQKQILLHEALHAVRMVSPRNEEKYERSDVKGLETEKAIRNANNYIFFVYGFVEFQ